MGSYRTCHSVRAQTESESIRLPTDTRRDLLHDISNCLIDSTSTSTSTPLHSIRLFILISAHHRVEPGNPKFQEPGNAVQFTHLATSRLPPATGIELGGGGGGGATNQESHITGDAPGVVGIRWWGRALRDVAVQLE
jgi:hypothetical protein